MCLQVEDFLLVAVAENLTVQLAKVIPLLPECRIISS